MTNFIRILLFLALLAPLTLEAKNDSYIVYSVTGKVYVVENKDYQSVTKGSTLKSGQRLSVHKGSSLCLIDKIRQKMYACSFQKTETKAVEEVVRDVRNPSSLTEQYCRYLMKKVFDKSSSQRVMANTVMQTFGNSYRGQSEDQLFINSLLAALYRDSIRGSEWLHTATAFHNNNDSIDCALVPTDSSLANSDKIVPNAQYYLRITNNSSRILFCNVLYCSPDGNNVLMLPVDSAHSCSDTLIPPYSTIDFDETKYEFDGLLTKESFVIVATDVPVNFTLLLSSMTKKTTIGGEIKVFVTEKMYKY